MSRRGPIIIIALLGVAAAVIFSLRHVPDSAPAVAVEAAPPTTPSSSAPGSAQAGAPTPAAAAAAALPVAEAAETATQGEIEGRVISTETRAGVPGVELTWSSAKGAHSARTDASGAFTFRPPEAGEYQLASAKAEGYLPFGPEWGKSSIAVTFRPGQRVRGLSVELEPAPQIKGRVVGAKGEPAAQASVRVLVPRKDELALFPIRERFTTDARGEFQFSASPYVTVEAFHPTLGSGSERLEAGARELLITLEPNAADAGARVTLIGRVVLDGEGAPGARVHVASALSAFPRSFGSSEGYRELTDESGRFTITELVAGKYDVSAHLLGTAPAHRFDVAVPSKSEVVLVLGSGGTLSGQVSEEGGPPVPSFQVRLEWRKAPMERLTVVEASFVDPNGSYSISGVASGDYQLEVRAAGFPPTTTQLVMPQAKHRVDVALRRGASVAGVVRDAETRQPINGAKVVLESTDRATVTDGAGAFVLEGMSRDGFSLQASAAGHNTKVVGVSQVGAPVEIELTPVAADAGPKTELAGLGLVLRGRGDALVVGTVLATGGGAAAGIQSGDELTHVDGKAVAELGFEPSIRSIRGPVGTQLELQVRKAGRPSATAVVATRKKVTN